MSSEKKPLGLNLSGLKPATYANVRITRSEPMGIMDGGRIGMPVGHAFDSSGRGDIREVIHRLPTPGLDIDPPKYDKSVQGRQAGPGTFTFRDEHAVPLNYLDQAKLQPNKPLARQNQPGASGGVRGSKEPLELNTKQVWTTDKGATIPNSGFEIRKKIWFEGQKQHPDSGDRFDLFKMRVTKEPKAVAIDFHGTSHNTGPGGGHTKKHHLFVGVVGEGEDRRVVTAKTRQGVMDLFRR